MFCGRNTRGQLPRCRRVECRIHDTGGRDRAAAGSGAEASKSAERSAGIERELSGARIRMEVESDLGQADLI